MQLELLFRPEPAEPPGVEPPITSLPPIGLWFVRNRRARRYILRLQPDGTGRVTIPRGGTMIEARQFAARHTNWLEQQRRKQRARTPVATTWSLGTELLFHGQTVKLEPGPPGIVRLGDRSFQVQSPVAPGGLRPLVERHLRELAVKELPPRVIELATLHQFNVRRISVRNQRSRWGSCSPSGTISLNWRLIQAPDFVRDYIILHELAHLREMNHSRRFWGEVARLCPNFSLAENWIKENAQLLR